LPLEKHETIERQIKSLKSLGISNLTSLSQQLIFWPEEKREEFIKEHADASLERHSTITVMTTILRASTEENAPSCLILGSESGEIFILDTQSFTVLNQAKTFPYKTSPALISATGQYDIDYQIVIATREGYLCLLRKGMLEGQLILKLEHPATGLALLPIDQTIIVVCMDKSLTCYSKKSKKLWGVTLPAAVVCMTPLHLSHLSLTIIGVGLQNGLVQLYSQKKLVDQFSTESTVSAMTFGRLGQEDHVLLLATIG
jgi:Bardet-Biedl syndrome 1 protein